MSNIDDTNEDTLELTGSIEYFDNSYQDDDDDDDELDESFEIEDEDENSSEDFELSSVNNIFDKVTDDLMWQVPVADLKDKIYDMFIQTNDVALKKAKSNLKKAKREAQKYKFGNDAITEIEKQLLAKPYNKVGSFIHSEYGKETNENLKMAYKEHYLKTPYALQHTIYNDVNFVSSFLRPYVIDKIKSQLGVDTVYKIGGIFYDQKSEASQKLAEHSQLKNFIKNNKNLLKEYGFIKKSSISFEDENWHNAIGKADIVDVYLDKNGKITFYVIDTYDFNKNSNVPEVKAGRYLQEKGTLMPYFMIYSVKIEKEEVERLLK